LKNLNAAKALAKKAGHSEIRHQDYVAAVGTKLHPAVPTEPVTYQKSMDFIAKRIYTKLSDAQQEVWMQEQENVRQLFISMLRDEGEGIRNIKLDDFIEKFNLIHLNVKGKALTSSQK